MDLKVSSSCTQMMGKHKREKSLGGESHNQSVNSNFKDLVKDNPMLGYLLPKYKNSKLLRPESAAHNISQPMMHDMKLLGPTRSRRNNSQNSKKSHNSRNSRNHSLSNPAQSLRDIKSSLNSEVSKKLMNLQKLSPLPNESEISSETHSGNLDMIPLRRRLRRLRRRKAKTKRTKLQKILKIQKCSKSLLKRAYKEDHIK